MSRYPMTKEGEISLRQELQKLKSHDRNNVVKAIAEAREHGDLKENSEYHAGTVIFGTTVGLKDLDERKLISYKIVGEDEADVKLGTISVNSPLSRSLVGKSEGDLVKLETPGGTKEYEILSIKHI